MNPLTRKNMKKRTILLCDDDPVDRKLFKKYLSTVRPSDYLVLEAENSAELNSFLADKNVEADIIFLDYYLGAENGVDILRELRKSNSAPVIMLTGRGDQEIAVECMKEGAMDYIPKETLHETDLRKLIRQAEEKWELERERDQLLGIAAHELRNPLAVILGYTEILQTYDELPAEKKSEILNVIHERSHHLLNIINELLTVTRVDKGIINLKKKQVNLHELLVKKVADYQLQAAKKSITILYNGEAENAEAVIDRDRIEEVVANLLDNAIKYSPRDRKVHVSLGRTGTAITITIRDEGQGIKEEELKFLFKLFSSKKISTLPTGEEASTGLGLAISKKVIDAHGGEIAVESRVGQGTSFKVILPLT